eukprot:g560.t1
MDICVFQFGSAVFFNCAEAEEARWLEQLKAFAKEDGSSFGEVYEDGEVDVDDMRFEYGSSSVIAQDQIVLESSNPTEKMAVAYAFAQSGRLSIYEMRADKEIERTNHIPREMARNGTVKMTSKELSRMIGSLHIQRSDVNLKSDILDSLPECLWDEDRFESVYRETRTYLDMEERVDTLNKRLDIMRELLEILHNQANEQHSVRLEWIIIYLIFLELIAQVLNFVDWSDVWDALSGEHNKG